MTADQPDREWRSAWPDAIAFVSVLALAWWTRAAAADLVWSLWLSSLVVGLSIMAWAALRPSIELAIDVFRRSDSEDRIQPNAPVPRIDIAFDVIAALFTLGFGASVFCFAHYIHGSILDYVLHIGPPHDWARPDRAQEIETLRLILRRYWLFLPTAFLAERTAFTRTPGRWTIRTPLTLEEDAARQWSTSQKRDAIMMRPYGKVLRMHMLIFFFMIAHFAGLNNFAVYAVVYAVYFFPWRLLDRPSSPYSWPAGPVGRRANQTEASKPTTP